VIGLDIDDFTPPAWHQDALCSQVDADAFFPEKGGSVRAAKRVCAECPVSGVGGPCLQYALDNDEKFGVWGGFTEDERRVFKNRPRRSKLKELAA
jgi:WhiB family transcriptional regulator, redox-sensing transcriptional regulator